MSRISHPLPSDYITPAFPSLWLADQPTENGSFLYYTFDIWRFTLLWTIIIYGVFHLAASGYAMAVQWRNLKYMWLVSIVYLIVGGIEAVLAGSIVGLILGAIYKTGYFRMSTWIPFIWSLISVLVLILSSFSIQGGL